jgi:hypothetical protein
MGVISAKLPKTVYGMQQPKTAHAQFMAWELSVLLHNCQSTQVSGQKLMSYTNRDNSSPHS